MMKRSTTELKEAVKRRAGELGFGLVRVASAEPPDRAEALTEWLEEGRHGSMQWLERNPERRMDPATAVPGARSVLTVAMNAWQPGPPEQTLRDPSRGRFARYAWGRDYHDLLTPRLRQLGSELAAMTGREVRWRAYVDTGPILERPLAAGAGMGFVGKHTLLIARGLGSWLFLGELLTDLELEPDEPEGVSFGCGDCRICREACPTGALDEPYRMDARLCISYLTIELRGPVPRELRPRMGNWVFGCDACQNPCPYNARGRQPTGEEHLLLEDPGRAAPKLTDLIALTPEQFRARYRKSAVTRTKRRGLLRNAAIALGNWGSGEALGPLSSALSDEEPMVRGHAAWALGRLEERGARRELERARGSEPDEWVRSEIGAALADGPVSS